MKLKLYTEQYKMSRPFTLTKILTSGEENPSTFVAQNAFRDWPHGSTLKILGINLNFSQSPINYTNNCVSFFEKGDKTVQIPIAKGDYSIDRLMEIVQKSMNNIGKQEYKVYLNDDKLCVIEAKEEFNLNESNYHVWEVLGFAPFDHKPSKKVIASRRPLLSPEGIYTLNLKGNTFEVMLPLVLSGKFNKIAHLESIIPDIYTSGKVGDITVSLSYENGLLVPLERDWSIIVQQIIA